MELIEIKNRNHLFKSIRQIQGQKDKNGFAVFFKSPWDDRCTYILDQLQKPGNDVFSTVFLIDSFETPDLFTEVDKTIPCTSVPVCYFYENRKRLREYKIFKEVLPSRILWTFGIDENDYWRIFADLKKVRNFFLPDPDPKFWCRILIRIRLDRNRSVRS